MYKLAGRRKLGRKSSHRKALVNNQVRSLLIHGKVRTTTPKAKVLKANADSLISQLSAASTNGRIELLDEYLNSKESIDKVTKYVGKSPSVKIVKVGFRSGDNAEMSRVDLVGFSKDEKKETKQKAEKPKADKKTEAKKEEKKEAESKAPEIDQKKATDAKEDKGKSNLGKSLRGRFTTKERARTRSGL